MDQYPLPRLYQNQTDKDTTYEVRLVVMNPAGCDSSLSRTVQVYSKVTADFAPVFTAFGAEGVNSPMPEAYQMVQKGIMDGLMGSLEGLKSFRLAEVAKYYTYIGLYRTHNGSRAMDIDVWNKLPADIKKVFEDNIDWWGLENDKYFEDAHKAGLEFGKQQKVEFITLSKDELAKFYSALEAPCS